MASRRSRARLRYRSGEAHPFDAPIGGRRGDGRCPGADDEDAKTDEPRQAAPERKQTQAARRPRAECSTVPRPFRWREEGGADNCTQLIEIMDADKSTMVYLVDELESQGLVERRPDPSDRRAYAVHLTDAGRARLVEAAAVAARVETEFLSPLTARERAQFDALLRRLADRPRRRPSAR